MSAKPATPEEKQEICKVMAKDMADMCVEEAMNDPAQMSIKAPPDLDTIREASQSLKDLAEEVKAKVAELTADGEEEPAEPASGGMLGGMMNMLGQAADVVQDGLGVVANLGAKGIAGGLVKMAEGLDATIAGVEEPMTTIGKDIAAAKKTEITDLVKQYIKGGQVPKAEELCMTGDNDAITKSLILAASDDISGKLKDPVEDAIKEHTAIKAWDACIENYNAMCTKLGEMKDSIKAKVESEKLDDFCPSPMEFDIKVYICQQTALEVGRLMGVAEARRRAAPQNMGSYPDIFLKVFRTDKTEERDKLMDFDYKEVTK